MNPEKLFELINGAIAALAKLLWPIVALIALLLFRKDITDLFHRLRKGKLFGQELELDPEVRELRLAVDQAEREVAPQVPPESETPVEASDSGELEAEEEIARLWDDAQASPEIGVMRLSALLEKELRLLLGSLGLLERDTRITAHQALARLSTRGSLPKHTTQSLRSFWDLRNKIVHGHATPETREVLSVLDIGVSLLRTIRAIPHEINYVYHPGVPVYADSVGAEQRPGVVAVILETHSPGRVRVTKRVYPTTRLDYYKKGRRVTWEWSFDNTWDESWYKDPDTDQPKPGWRSSAEFVGRHTDEL
ncbi:MAG: hypothetical protein R3284_09655 [Rubricoccaceae bacterium]|nr:hypothetical protein [Rubricoccaceae bacterium]